MGNYKGLANYKPAVASAGFFKKVVKTTETSIANDSTLNDDPDLQFAASANKIYFIILFMYIEAPTAEDIKYQWSIPASATLEVLDGSLSNTQDTALKDGTTIEIIASSTGNKLLVNFCRVIIAGTSGDVKLQWCQSSSGSGPTKMLTGSTMLVVEE